MARLPKNPREWGVALFSAVWALVFGVLIVGFLSAWAEEVGVFSNPSAKVSAFLHALQALPMNVGFAWAAGLALGGSGGFAFGVWLDAIRRAAQAENSPTSALPVTAPITDAGHSYSRPWQTPSRVDFDAWDNISRMNLAQAAYLWGNREPPPLGVPILPEHAARLTMLIQAVEDGLLTPITRTSSPDHFTEVTRRSLIGYADHISQSPAFLFPEIRAARQKG